MVEEKSPKRTQVRKVITFWNGIKAAIPMPFQCEGFCLARYTESEIANWQGPRRKTLKKEIQYEDGSIETESSLLDVAYWDLGRTAHNPDVLKGLVATEFAFSEESFTALRGGTIRLADRRTNVTHLLLRLTRRGFLEPVREFIFSPEQSDRARSTVLLKEKPSWPLENWIEWVLDAEAGQTLSRLARALWKTLYKTYDEWDDDCLVLESHFVRAVTQSRVDSEIDLWIALEAMFNPSDRMEVGFRIAQSAALFVGRSPDECLQIFDLLRKRYSIRSGIMHGSHKPTKVRTDVPYTEIYEELCKLDDIVRVAARRYLLCRLVSGLSRKEILQTLERGTLDSKALEALPSDPASDEGLSPSP